MAVPERTRRGDTAGAGELAGRLRLAVGRLSRQLNQRAKGELTLSQWSALAATAKRGPMRLGELAAHEHVSAPVLTKVVADLESTGLVVRETDPVDARASLLSATAAGEQRLAELRAVYADLVTDLLTDLTGKQRDALATALPVLEDLADRLACHGDRAGAGVPSSGRAGQDDEREVME